MVFTRSASSELQFGALRKMAARERQGALSEKSMVEHSSTHTNVPWHVLSGELSTRFGEGGGKLNR